MIDVAKFMESYLTKGYYCFNAVHILQKLSIEAFEPIKDRDATFITESPEERYTLYTPAQEARLRRLSMELSDYSFSCFRHSLRFSDMWATSNPNTYDWHTDTIRCWKGFNSSVNCYYDDNDETTGGAFQVKPIGTNEISTIYPKYGDVIVINQHPGFVHRVTHSDQPRKMVAFAAAFFDFNPI